MIELKDHKMVYLAGPYSGAKDKEDLMRRYMTISGTYMLENAGHHVTSPLFNHYSLAHVPGMGSDYNFWGDYSRNLLKRCDKVIVVKFPDWDESPGVQDEIALARQLNLNVEFIDPEDYGC